MMNILFILHTQEFNSAKKHTEKDLVQPTYMRKDFVQITDSTYIGTPYNKKTMYVGIGIVFGKEMG